MPVARSRLNQHRVVEMEAAAAAAGAGGLVSWVRAGWVVATLPFLTAWFPLPGLRGLRSPLSALAKRGKNLQSTSSAPAAATVPQRFFSHFYAVGILWTTLLLVSVWFFAINTDGSRDLDDEHAWLSVFMLLLMEAQLLRRFYESVKVFNYSPYARVHILAYFGGILYYIAAPLSLCCTIAPQVLDFMKEKFIVRNYKDEIWRWSSNLQQKEVDIWGVLVTPLLRRLPWYVWIGAAIFLWGSLHQLRCHQILGSLRNKPEKMDEYAIPYGDWFEYVSSAHYTAEIVIYGGLVISGGADLTLWLLFAFVVANLGSASAITHKWYKQKFDDYPGNRRAIFPFVY